MMAKSHVTSRQMKHWFGSVLSLLFLAIVFASIFSSPHVCASSDEGPEHVPTLKEIYGSVPKNSFPVVHRDARTIQSDMEFRSNPAHPMTPPQSLRRGLQSKPHAFTVPVTNTNPFTGSYFAQMQIGTPPQSLLLQIDTGSQIFWVQDARCNPCYTELLPQYSRNLSSTFEVDVINGTYVRWGIHYGGGSFNVGVRARETLTIDSGDGNWIVIPEFQFGLSVNNSNYSSFTYFSGLIGLIPVSSGSLSVMTPFLAQLDTLSNGSYSKFSKQFRYCFPERTKQRSTASFLSFGKIDESDTNSLFSSAKNIHESRILWTPLVPNDPISFYALNMTAISVGGYRIPIDPQELTLESVRLHQTMTIIDSGTTRNMLREPYFSQFVAAYYDATSQLNVPTIVGPQGQLIFNISTDFFDSYLFPTVSLIFQKWNEHDDGEKQEEIEIFLPKENVLTLDDNLYELTVKQSRNNLSIIGNFGQQSFLIEYDLEKSRVGFLRASCTFEY